MTAKFEAQYNQRPLPPGGALFKAQWLQRYDKPPERHQVEGIFQSLGTAYSTIEVNDYKRRLENRFYPKLVESSIGGADR